jgi:hypothetical protein
MTYYYEHLEYITQEGEIIKNLNKGEFYKYLGINQSNHIQHSIIKENLEKQFYLRIKSILKSKLNGNNLIFCSTLSEFENFLLCERILINLTTCQNETSS